jgi:hypothetical protein
MYLLESKVSWRKLRRPVSFLTLWTMASKFPSLFWTASTPSTTYDLPLYHKPLNHASVSVSLAFWCVCACSAPTSFLFVFVFTYALSCILFFFNSTILFPSIHSSIWYSSLVFTGHRLCFFKWNPHLAVPSSWRSDPQEHETRRSNNRWK